ncbi:MAG: hypothetical protein ACJAWQ_002833 [Paraglaciecola sp.]|jgi:hypothetical protein
MQSLNQSETLQVNNSSSNSQEIFSAVGQSFCLKLMVVLELLVVLIQKTRSILLEQHTNIQQHNWYLSTKATSFTHQENKP